MNNHANKGGGMCIYSDTELSLSNSIDMISNIADSFGGGLFIIRTSYPKHSALDNHQMTFY